MKILIVDDEQIHNFISIRLFRQISPDLTLFDFTDPTLALAELPAINPDIIFLDLNMPKINGWDFLDKMIKNGQKEKVIILTSSVSTFDHDKAREYSNVLECIEKPIKKEKLLAILQQNGLN